MATTSSRVVMEPVSIPDRDVTVDPTALTASTNANAVKTHSNVISSLAPSAPVATVVGREIQNIGDSQRENKEKS